MLGLWLLQETAMIPADGALTWMFLQAISQRILIIIHRPPDKSPFSSEKLSIHTNGFWSRPGFNQSIQSNTEINTKMDYPEGSLDSKKRN